MPEKYPFRGPKEMKKGEYEYKNSWTGNIDRYFGEEEIVKRGKRIYYAKYMGGVVDANNGL